MTQHIEEWAEINTFHSVSAMIAIDVINIITVPVIAVFGDGNDKIVYLLITILYGCIFAACHIFCFAKTEEVVAIPEKKKISLKVQLASVAKNRPYMIAVAGQFLFEITLYGRNADALYYFTYVEGNKALFSNYSLFIIIPSVIGATCFTVVFRLTNNKGRSASIFVLLTGISIFYMYFFTVEGSPIPFICSRVWHSFSSPDLTLLFTQLFRIAWNMGNGRQDFETLVSNMLLFLLEIK